jgi:hypothetical protein
MYPGVKSVAFFKLRAAISRLFITIFITNLKKTISTNRFDYNILYQTLPNGEHGPYRKIHHALRVCDT